MHHGRGNMEPDQTLEILMTDLDPKIMRIFSKEVCKSGQEATLVGYVMHFISINAVVKVLPFPHSLA